jgi:hypothetical protein
VKHRPKSKVNLKLSEDIQVEEIFPDEEWEREQHIRMKSHPIERNSDGSVRE